MVWNGHTHKLTDVAVFVFTCQCLFEPLMSDMHDQVRLLSSFSPRHRYYNRVNWPMLSGRQVRWLCRRSNSVFGRKLSMSRVPTKVQVWLHKNATSGLPWRRGWSRSMVLAEAWLSTVHQTQRCADKHLTLLNDFFVIFRFRRSVACGRILNSRLEAESTVQMRGYGVCLSGNSHFRKGVNVESCLRPDWGLDEL